MDGQDIMSFFRTRYVSIYLFLLIQTISGQANFTNMNLTQVPVGQIPLKETDIHLSKNLISQVEENAFVNFPNLSKLFLDHNQISFLSDLAFNGTSIQDLEVSYNKLTALPKFASIGNSLQYLRAGHNMITKIGEDELKGVTRLQQLLLYSNKLTFVHSEAFLDCANSMSRLRLSHNPSLTSIPAEIFTGMGQLDYLDFQSTALTSFPDFGYLPVNNSLTSLFISSPSIGDLPTNALYKLGKLRSLFLYSPGMTILPDFSRQRGILINFHLRGTRITDIPNTTFDNFPLRSLSLSNNKLIRLPNLQSIQSTIERFDISRNNLSTVTCEEIHEMIANCPLLKRVGFQYTNIKTFPDILQFNRSFRSISILNPFTMRCDCAMEWIIGLDDLVYSDITGSSMPCAAPPQLVGRKWATINRTDLCNDNEAVSCNFKPQLLSTTSTSIPTFPDTTKETVEMNSNAGILASALGVSLGVVFLILVIVVVVFVCRMRSSSSSNKSRDNKHEGGDNPDNLEIVDGTFSEPASHYTELTEPPTNPNEAGVYDEIGDLVLGPFAKGAQAGVVTGTVPVYNNVTTSDAISAVDQNEN